MSEMEKVRQGEIAGKDQQLLRIQVRITTYIS